MEFEDGSCAEGVMEKERIREKRKSKMEQMKIIAKRIRNMME